jgi:enamine deaminase RidA (YjgF/YER057c/UK114 family)
VGKGDFAAQSEQALKNIQAALAAGGANPEHVVKLNIYVLQGQNLQEGFAASQRLWGSNPNPPTVSVLFVAGLAHPDFLVEIDAIAVVPE